eukprot:TRINITY_DN1591_c0_g1_i2.p1 TRINITY_DN1591_c0_g1~~TRINITY_DN1591_c0_g1_i2.p1  ORF type:complete len:333 (-),score=99.04 TRINITY_DN1591_c0_g1_i2:84-1082(-)
MAGGVTSVAKLGLATAIRYGASRKQFGEGATETAVLDYLVHQRRLMPLVASAFVYGNMANVIKTLWLREKTPENVKEVHLVAAGLKSLVTWNAHATLQACRECCGGQGFGTANRIGILKNDLDVWLTFEGDNMVLLQQVSRFLLKEFQRAQSKNDWSGVLSFVPNAAAPSSTDVDSVEFQRAAFNVRVASLLQSAVITLMKNAQSAPSLLDAWNASTDITNELAKSYSERMVFEEFVTAVAAAPTDIQDVLNTMRSLFALTKLHEDASFYRTTDFVVKSSRAINSQINKLCVDLRQHSSEIVESFGINPKLLGPIAGDWVDYYSAANTLNHN